MIRCQEFHLKQRAEERGYTLAEVQACIAQRNPDGSISVDTSHPQYPRPKKGLGDRVADGLSAIGITKERVRKLVGKDCGCKKRQQWLNQVGAKYLGIGHTPSSPDAD